MFVLQLAVRYYKQAATGWGTDFRRTVESGGEGEGKKISGKKDSLIARQTAIFLPQTFLPYVFW